ncbi:hypothetical protein HY407_01680 [Candidatus Gottesmanbacteria bacterium]|nr:hypothetical protein [Candidatus Gottesmanbacteria bacterium]
MKVVYNHLEHLHKKYGLALHSSIFMFSLLLGIGIGIVMLLVNLTELKMKTSQMKLYEQEVMDQLVKKIEAASPQ